MEIILKPEKWAKINVKELWQFRELFFILAWRDIKVRYKQTAIGAVWAILQPFLMMVVFSIFFGRIAGISSEGIPYPIFAYAGLLFWNFFSNSLTSISDSMVVNKSIIQKVYFPRLIIPASSAFVFLVDFLFAGLVLVGLMVYFHIIPTFLGVIMIVPSLLIALLSALGLGLFFAAVNVKYRDVRYALPFFIQLLIFVTPVIYSTNILGDHQWLWYLNPMSGVINLMRSLLLQSGNPNWVLYCVCVGMSILLFLFGFTYFRRMERRFADLV